MNIRDFRKHAVVTLKRARNLLMPPRAHNVNDHIADDGLSRSVTEQFHLLWYGSPGSQSMKWMGHPILKNPMDLWLYQEILYARRPRLLIETGTHHGGSALYFAMVAQMAKFPLDVVTIDFNPKLAYEPAAYHIHSVRGISTTSNTIDQVKTIHDRLASEQSDEPFRAMVVLDSDHSMENVLEELGAYGAFVTNGDFLVVEDTNVNGHPVMPEHGPGPYEAVEQFLQQHVEFVRDVIGDKLLVTHNPGGWLRRVDE